MNTIKEFKHGGVLMTDCNKILQKIIKDNLKFSIRARTLSITQNKTAKNQIRNLFKLILYFRI